MQGELYSALKNEKEQPGTDSSTTFSGEMHFYELVEDTKDGIWLVQVSGFCLFIYLLIKQLNTYLLFGLTRIIFRAIG